MTSKASEDGMDELVQSACEAAARGDAATVVKCLHSPPVAGAATGLDELLFPISEPAQYLLENLNSTSRNPEHALRALMPIPSCYETPWRAALQMISAFHSQSGTLGKQSGKVLWTCVTDVQTFLQLTVEAWWKLERQRTSSSTRRQPSKSIPGATTNVTPRHLLEQLADAILQPLNDNNEEISSTSSSSSRDNQHWTQPLELITTIVSTCQDLEPSSETNTLSKHVLNRLFPSSIRPDRLLPWLTLVSDLRSHLQGNDWTRLHDILQHVITKNAVDAIPPSDLPGLVRGIVSFLAKQQQQEDDDWELLILHLLYSASQDATTYSTVETVLKSSLKSLPNPILTKCLDSVRNTAREGVPNWICSNMNLLLLQAVQQSGSLLVSNLVSRALGGQDAVGGGNDLQRQCWESLKELTFPSTVNDSSSIRRKDKNVAATIKATLGGVYYQGNGQFAKEGDESMGRDITSKLVCESIFLGKTKPSKQSHHVFASERAQLWVHAADTILRPSLDVSGPQNSLDVLLAMLIMVTVYCEVPASRSTIVRSTMQYLSAKDGFMVSDDVSSYHCILVAMIVGSLTRDSQRDNGIQDELRPLTDIFGESLTKDVFCDLTSALSPLSSARSALLSVSQKYLQSTFGGNLWWDVGTASRGMQENRDRTDCAIHGLCTLIVATENQTSWDDYGIEAWSILSEVLVQNKPALPMSERSALFQRLSLFTERNKFSLKTIEHLLRMCLVRFLQFFEGDDEDSLELIPERVFVAWGSRNALNEARACVSPREDVVGLLRLVMLLLEHQATLCDKEASGKEALCQGRDRILLLLSGGGRVRGDVPVTNAAHPPLASDIVCACLAAILRSSMSINTQSRTARDGRRRIEGIGTLERWREHLISAEIEECKAYGTGSGSDNHLSWLQLSSQEGAADTGTRRLVACDISTKHGLLSSMCDIVLDLIFRPVWSDDAGESTDEERNDNKQLLTKCTFALLSLKRDLSKHCDGGIHVKDSGLAELSFDSATLSASAVPVLELCSHFMSNSLSQGATLDAVENVLLSLLTYCSALKELACDEGTSGKTLDSRTRLRIARQLWELYSAIGEESSAQHLLRYLEEKGVAQLETEPDETRTSRSFLIIRTDDDVDAIVQRVRLSIVSTIGAWFQALPESSTESFDGTLNTGTCQLSCAFWLQVLGRVSSDVKTGLDGESGGMTEALYTAYLSLMESVCKLVSLAMSQETDVSRLQRVSHVALECERRLKEVLCTFPLKGATQFKKTMMLSISEFPSIQRQATVMLVALGEGSLPSKTTGSATEVFHQMMRLTERHYRLGKLEGTTWSEIAGPEHVSKVADDEDENSDDDSMDREGGLQRNVSAATDASSNIPSMIAIPGDRETRRTATTNATSEQKLQLPSKESWIWASCCSLLAMEQIWVESYSILNGNSPCNPQSAPAPAQSYASYCKERTKSLSNVIKAACFAIKSLKELKGGNENQSKEDAATILATSFTDVVKVRFCMLLEKISAVLQIALRSVSSQIKKGEDDVTDLIRAESMACMSAWLSVEAQELGLESLSKRWYHAEKQLKEGKAGTGGIHRRLSPSLRRLPKFLVRTQELETDLSKLYQMLGKIEDETSGQQQQVLDQYESLLDSQTDNEAVQDSLQSMIKAKLKSLAKARASSEAFNLTLVGKVDDSSPAPRKRTRKAPNLERQMRRERRRNVKRSRNQVVDEWLHLDDEYDMDEGVDDDAYVDLEDFIV